MDASATGIEAVLMQQDDRGKNHVIAYVSRTLNSAECNYSVTDKETRGSVGIKTLPGRHFWISGYGVHRSCGRN